MNTTADTITTEALEGAARAAAAAHHVPRADAERARLEALGIEGPALEALVAESARVRAAARVAATRAAACGAALALVPEIQGEGSLMGAVAAVLLAADLLGVGGPGGLGGPCCGTARAPWGRFLGAGRWQAQDGGAWRSAARQALVELGCVTVRPDPDAPGLSVRAGQLAPLEDPFAWVPLAPLGAWGRTLVGELLRRSAGFPGRAGELDPYFPTPSGDVAEWGRLFNRLAEPCPAEEPAPTPDDGSGTGARGGHRRGGGRWCRGHGWGRKHTDQEYTAALDAAGGNRSAAARALGVVASVVSKWIRRSAERKARWPGTSWRGFRSEQELDRGYKAALVEAGGDRRAAAEALGVSLATVHRWVRARQSRRARWNRRSR